MKMKSIVFRVALAVSLVLGLVLTVEAALTASQRRDLSRVRRDLARASSFLRRKKLDDAEKLIEKAETTINKIVKDAKLKPTDRNVSGLLKSLAKNKQLLAVRRGKNPASKPVSFSKDVAPILASRCLSCHGNRASGGLRLNNFAGLSRGGRNGPAIRAGKPTVSLLLRRVATPNAAQRMPKNAAALTRPQLQTIAAWIAQGAKFDGGNANTPLAQLKSATGKGKKAKKKMKPTSVKVVKATGKEKVSFVKQVAPTLATLCAGCHGARNGRGGFSVNTFETVLQGSDSGRVVLPGNPEASIIWRRVAALDKDKQKMPPGNRRITREFYNSLKTWIEEGAKFDGESAKVTLRSLVPTDEQMRAAELAKLSTGEFNDLRETRTNEMWDRVASDDRPRFVKSKEFFVFGDAAAARLQQVAEWAEDHAKELRKLFGDRGDQLWKGRLAVIVFKDRFGYTEWNQVIHRRDTPREMHGHSVVSPSFEDAYVVLQDVGDDVSAEAPGLKLQLVDHVTGAFLKRKGGSLPQWMVRGTGLSLAAKTDPKNDHIAGLRGTALESVRGLSKPAELFADGTFSPSQVGAVGYTLVNFMIKAGGTKKFVRFVRQLQAGTSVSASVKAVYAPTDLKQLAALYLRSISGRGKKR